MPPRVTNTDSPLCLRTNGLLSTGRDEVAVCADIELRREAEVGLFVRDWFLIEKAAQFLNIEAEQIEIDSTSWSAKWKSHRASSNSGNSSKLS